MRVLGVPHPLGSRGYLGTMGNMDFFLQIHHLFIPYQRGGLSPPAMSARCHTPTVWQLLPHGRCAATPPPPPHGLPVGPRRHLSRPPPPPQPLPHDHCAATIAARPLCGLPCGNALQPTTWPVPSPPAFVRVYCRPKLGFTD